MSEETEEKAYAYAIRLLKVRLRSKNELLFRLERKSFPAPAIRAVLHRLASQGFLNDEHFAEACLETWKRLRDWGYWGMRAKLLSLRVPKSIAEEALIKFFPHSEEVLIARRVVRKQQKNKNPLALGMLLARKGFRSDAIREVLSQE